MIEVRIREAADAEPVHLCTWPADDLDHLIPTVQAWGVLASGDLQVGPGAVLHGQFRLDGPEAYFELTIHDAEGGDE